MDLLAQFLNRDDLSRHVTTSMIDLLAYQNESGVQQKNIDELTRLLDALPTSSCINSLPVATQLFDHLLLNSTLTNHHRLLSACLSLMTIEDRIHRINNILWTILDVEQSLEMRELLCKLLSSVKTSLTEFDWIRFEATMQGQPDLKFVTCIWRFLSNHQTILEQILVRTLPNTNNQDELFLLLLVDLRSLKLFVKMAAFWRLIQRSLGSSSSNNDRTRKCALYLLKGVLADDEFKHIEMREENELHGRLLISIDDRTKQFWMDFIVVYEALEDGVVHLIKPILTRFDRLLRFSLDHGLSLTWLFILLQRLFANTSFPLARWAVRWFLNNMHLPDAQVEAFFLDTVLDWLSNNYVFLKGDDTADQQSMDHCFELYLERWLNSVENQSAALLPLLSRILTVKWSHMSLACVLHALRTFVLTHHNQALLGDEHVKLFSTLISTQFHTYAPVLRLSAYSSILDLVVNLIDWTISSTSTNLIRFFTFFDRRTFLSNHFQTISSHFPFHPKQFQIAIDEFLSSDSSNSSLDTRLFSFDSDFLQCRHIAFLLDLTDLNNTDVLKTMLGPLIENIRTAHKRPYMSIDNVRRSIQLCDGLIHETYFHSSTYVKDWLSSTIRSITREGLDFVRMHATKQPMVFARLPIVFFSVGNHSDISRFLQDLINQMETMQQQSNSSWQALLIVFAHAIDWLLTHRLSDFNNEWKVKFRVNPLLSKQLDQNSNSIPQADILIGKYLLVANGVVSSSPQVCANAIDDLFKASTRELSILFRAVGKLLRESEITDEDKRKLIDKSLVVMNEVDHRMPIYWSCLAMFCQAISPSVNDASVADELTQWFAQSLEKGAHISGIMNTILESISPIWLRDHRVQSCHLPTVVECVIFGQIYQKDKKLQWQAEQLLEQDQSLRSLISNTQITPEYRYDRNVRVLIQSLLLHMWPSFSTSQQNDVILQVIDKHRRIASKDRRPRFCTNSLEHRIMFRALQCLLCLTAVIKDKNLLKIIYEYAVETLIAENEPSLRLLAEWIIVRLIMDDRTTRLLHLYAHLRDAHRHRTGTVCAWLSIASHMTNLLTDQHEQIEYINTVFGHLAPLLIHSNFHIRTFAISTLIKLLRYIEQSHLQQQTRYEAFQCFKQNDDKSELGRYTAKLQSLFLYQFESVRDFSLETIFHTLPKLSFVADDEWLAPDWFIDISQQLHLTFPLSVHNVSTVLNSCEAGIWKLTSTGKSDVQLTAEEESSSTIQHKANPYPIVEPLDDCELRANIKRTELVVVASLIDKQANLGGLCRTGEIFGVKELVLGSLRVLEDQQFLNLSMTAHKWLRIREVQEKQLKTYLIDMQAQGYSIVAVEQTVNSQSLYQFEFPTKTLLLLGNEREGIRADLLSLVDATVEIPQAGVIRSLNVHVSGALCISEYARKYLNLLK